MSTRAGAAPVDATFTMENQMSYNWRVAAVVALAGTVMLAPSAHTQTVSCKSLGESLTRNVSVPYHAYVTTTAGYNGGKSRQSEIISTGSVIYVNVNGKWRRSPVDPREMAETQRQAADSISMLYSCTRTGSETVNGTATQRYHIEKKKPEADDTSKQDIWVDSKGMIRQVVRDADVGGGAAGRSHSVMRYEYTNVSAPPGVQ